MRRQADEGANYNDSVAFAAKPGDGVPPSGVYTYRWAAPARAGPGPDDGDTVSWLYHSHLDEGADVAAGLVRGGPECRSSAGIHSDSDSECRSSARRAGVPIIGWKASQPMMRCRRWVLGFSHETDWGVGWGGGGGAAAENRSRAAAGAGRWG